MRSRRPYPCRSGPMGSRCSPASFAPRTTRRSNGRGRPLPPPTMRLPGKLLDQIRVGVGVGAVLLCGCDVVDATLSEVAPADEAVSVAPVALPEAPKTAPAKAAPKSGGLADKVVETLGGIAPAPSEPEPPVVAEAEPAPEDVTAFIPFGGSASSSSPSPKPLPRAKRVKPKVVAAPIAIDEPCETPVSAAVAPTHDPCPACGRG